MPNIRITINNKVEFDGFLDQWSNASPEFLKNQVKPGRDPEPWMKAILISLSDAINGEKDTTIEARHSPGEWALRVKDKE